MSDKVANQVADTITAVQNATKSARAKWSSWRSGVGDYLGIGARDQVLSAIAQMERALDSWANQGRKIANSAVVAENLGPGYQARLDAWIRDGNAHLRNLRGIAQDADDSQLSRIITDTVQASINDVGGAAKATASGIAAVSVWIRANAKRVGVVAVAVVVAIVVWKYGRIARAVLRGSAPSVPGA